MDNRLQKLKTLILLWEHQKKGSKINIFKGIKYKWGGKDFNGVDCSALVQLFFNFNNKFCPRDTKDQLNYFKKKN